MMVDLKTLKIYLSVSFHVAFFGFLGQPSALQAQELMTLHLSESENLSDIEFYDVIEDRDGFVWFTADQGLSKYDGSHFIHYENTEKKGHGVFGLYEDQKGRIWCNNLYGQFFYVENDSMYLFATLEELNEVRLMNFAVIDEVLIIVFSSEILAIDLETKQRLFTHRSNHNIKPEKLDDNRIIVCSDSSLFQVNARGVQLFHSFQPGFTHRNSIIYSHQNTLFVSKVTAQGENEIFQVNGDELIPLEVPAEIRSIRINKVYSKSDVLWFCTNNGIRSYSINKGSFKLKHIVLPGENVSNVVLDKNQALWVTTIKNGIFLVPNIGIKGLEFKSPINNISCLEIVDEHTLCAGTTDGKIVLSRLDKSDEHVIHSEDDMNRKIYCLGNTKNGIYYGQSSLKLLDLKTFKVKKAVGLGAIKGISVSGNEMIYGASNGAFLMDLDRNVSTTRFVKSRCKTIYASSHGTRYLGTINGLYAIDQKENKDSILFENRAIMATDISETDDGTIWVSTVTNGILGLIDTEVKHQFTINDGLASSKIVKIKGDGNQLWVASNKGLQLLDIQSKELKNLTSSDGIISNAITGIEILKNDVFVSSNKGVVYFDKRYVFKDWLPPVVSFVKVKINDEDTFGLCSKYVLRHDQNKLEIFFNAPGFYPNGKVVYQYRLKGQDSSWNTVNKQTESIKLLNLNPGSYRLELRSMSKSSGVIYSDIKEIGFVIRSPFWKTNWFLFLALLLIVSLGYVTVRWVVNVRNKKQLRLLEKTLLDKENTSLKLENLRSQMNPHFIFNALNSIQEYIVLNHKTLAQDYLVKFSMLIRLYLEHSQKKSITLESELKALNLYLELENLRLNDTLQYEVLLDDYLQLSKTLVPPVFIQPYIENAINHGLLHKKHDRRLRLRFKANQKLNELVCVIEDNGIGREKSQFINKANAVYHKPFATFANSKRLILLNRYRARKYTVTTEDVLGENRAIKGTKVTISIPINYIAK